MDKKLIKDLTLVVWWALRLYVKRLKNVIYYGITYREQLHTWYNHYQETRNINYDMGFDV